MMRTTARLLLLLTAVSVAVAGKKRNGTFLHLTDLHYDPRYVEGGDATHYCWASKPGLRGSLPPDAVAGRFGHDNCDSPKILIDESLEYAKSIAPEPDFIIWTGDDPPHVSNSVMDEAFVESTVVYLSESIRKLWPNTRVVPAIGNHDNFPAHQVPAHANPMFNLMEKEWHGWMKAEDATTFHNYGYYSTWVKPPSEGGRGLKILAMNTVFYYNLDKQNVGVTDPGHQYAWAQAQLNEARNSGHAIYLIAHLPPGPGISGQRSIRPEFNKPWLELIHNNADVIVGQFYGHLHRDEIRVFKDPKTGKPNNVAFLAGSFTPWTSRRTHPDDSSNNPGVRVFQYDVETFQVLDYHQYYADLNQANQSGHLDWKLEYSARDAYGLPSPLSAAGYYDLYERFVKDHKLATQYWRYARMNKQPTATPSADQLKKALCAIVHHDYDEWDAKCK